MCEQIERDIPPNVGQIRQLVTPQIAIEEYAMHEQCDRPAALFRVTDAPGRGLNAMPRRH
jgi:hypothetical protein